MEFIFTHFISIANYKNKKKMKPYIVNLLVAVLFFLIPTKTIFAQDEKKVSDKETTTYTYLKNNPYKGSRYQDVYTAVMHLKHENYPEAQQIIDRIQESTEKLVVQKRDNTERFSVYNSLYYLTLTALTLEKPNPTKADRELAKEYLAKANKARKKIKSSYDLRNLQKVGFSSLVERYTPKPPPPPKPRELTEEEKIELKLTEIAEKVEDDIKTMDETIREKAGREKHDRALDGIEVGNCDEDIKRLDLKIKFDYMEEGFSNETELKTLELNNDQLNSVINVLTNIVKDFVLEQNLTKDDVSVVIVSQSDSTTFKQNFLLDRIPIKGKVYDEKEIIYITTNGKKKRLRNEGLILTRQELAASRVELAKHKLRNSHEIMEDINIETKYSVGNENKVFIKLVLKNAFTIYLDDLKEDVQVAMFSKVLDKKCVCAVRCANCDEYKYCNQCPDCQTDEAKK